MYIILQNNLSCIDESALALSLYESIVIIFIAFACAHLRALFFVLSDDLALR